MGDNEAERMESGSAGKEHERLDNDQECPENEQQSKIAPDDQDDDKDAFEGPMTCAELVATLEAPKAHLPRAQRLKVRLRSRPSFQSIEDGSRPGRPPRPTCTQPRWSMILAPSHVSIQQMFYSFCLTYCYFEKLA
jgi:hypothetical protein